MAKTSELEDSDATGPGTAKLQMPTVDMSGQTAGTVEQENTDLTKLAGSLEPPVHLHAVTSGSLVGDSFKGW